MNSTLVKASKAIKESTSTSRIVLDAVNRAEQMYLAQIKRAEAELFDRIKNILAKVTGESESATPEAAPAVAPSEVSAPPPA